VSNNLVNRRVVPDMLKTSKKLVAASRSEIWRLPLPYTLLQRPLRCLEAGLSILIHDRYKMRARECKCSQHRDDQFPVLCGQRPSFNLEVS